jgi:hypothetical protein
MAEMNRQVEANLSRIIDAITNRPQPGQGHAAS